MQSKSDIFSIDFPQAKSVVISGDIHGDFNLLVFKLCVQYQMTDTLLIVAGDCGFGFEQKGYYDEIAKKNNKRMTESNNWIVFIRGNHDNPAYFDGTSFNYKRFIAVPDYALVKACQHTILCIGGAVSIDRKSRINSWQNKVMKEHRYNRHKTHFDERFDKNYYWTNEAPIYNELVLDELDKFQVDIVITHSAPSFCELQAKGGLSEWCNEDENLLSDVNQERYTLDRIYKKLKCQNHPLSRWYYGHFHQSWHTVIDNTLFRMLDIMEFCQLPCK